MKFLNGLKSFIVAAWFIFIYAIFYVAHKYYFVAAYDSFFEIIFFILCGAAVFFSLKFILKKFHSIHLRTLFAILLILPILLTSYEFFSHQISVVTGGTIVKENSKVLFLESGASTDGKEIIFEEDLPVLQTERVLKQLPENLHQYFHKVSFLKSMAYLEKNIFLDFAGALAFFILFSSLGLTIFFRANPEPKDRAISFFLGAGITSLVIFFLGVFEMFNAKTFLAYTVLAALISHRAILDNLKFLFTTKLKEFSTKNLAILSTILIFFAMASVDFIRVMPIAWDDSNLYMRGAKLFTAQNIFIEGVGPSAWTLLQSIGWLFTNTPQLTGTLLFATLATGAWIFYLISRKFLDESESLLATVFLLGIPMLTFLSVLDVKTEIPLLFSGAAAILSWFEWREKKEKKYLFIASILLGFTATIKITSIIFIAVMFLATLYLETEFALLATSLVFLILSVLADQNSLATLNAFNIGSTIPMYSFIFLTLTFFVLSLLKEKTWKYYEKFYPSLQMLTIIAMVFAPWAIFQLYNSEVFSLSNMIFGSKHILNFLPTDYPATCSNVDLTVAADYKRYTGGGEGLKALLLFPFYTTMTFNLTTFISDVTPIFLSIIPLWLLKPKKLFKENKKALCLLIFTFAYLILWALSSSGVMWYGIFALIPLIILVFFTRKQIKYLSIFIVITLLANFAIRVNFFGEIFNLSYAFGIQSAEKVIDGFYPGFTDVSKILSNTPEAKLYRMGSQIKFFLPIADKNILDDDYLGYFTCMASGKNVEQIKQAFVNVGLTHVFISTNSGLGDVAFGDVYAVELEGLKTFLKNSGWPLLYDDHAIQLYEIK